MRALVIALAGAALAAPALAAPPGWLGRYVYEQSLGKAPSGMTPYITHILTLGPKTCTLYTEGFQTYEHLYCDAIWRGNSVTVTFNGLDNRDPDANHLMIRPYRQGEPLLTLTKTASGMQTRWLGYTRAPEKGPKVGRFFR